MRRISGVVDTILPKVGVNDAFGSVSITMSDHKISGQTGESKIELGSGFAKEGHSYRGFRHRPIQQ